MNNNLTDITIVLDRSSSMFDVADETIKGFNKFLQDQKNAPGDAVMTLHLFNTTFSNVIFAENIQKTPELTMERFNPSGMTALYDAIGIAIDSTGDRLSQLPENERPGKVVFVILTDGLENSSRKFRSSDILEKIEHQKSVYNWEFVFLGANQDAITTAGQIGIIADNAITYAANSIGTSYAFDSTSKNLVSMRSGIKRGLAYSDTDRELQRKAGA